MESDFMRAASRMAACLAASALCGFAQAASLAGAVDEFPEGALPDGWSGTLASAVSRDYPSEALSVEIVFDGASGGDVSIYALSSSGADDGELLGSAGPLAESAVFTLPSGSGRKAFRVESAGGRRVRSFAANWLDDSLPAPAGVSAKTLFHDSALVSWEAVEGAAGYLMTVYTNATVGASDGTAAWTETFAKLDLGSSKGVTAARLAAADDPAAWEGAEWTNATMLDAAPGVKLGQAKADGAISMPGRTALAGENALAVLAYPFGAGEGQELAAGYLGEDGSTNAFARTARSQALADGAPDSPARCVFAIPEEAAGRCIVFYTVQAQSSKNHRVAIAGISILSGYADGETRAFEALSKEVAADATEAILDGLPAGVAAGVTVAAVGSAGTKSEASEIVWTDLASAPQASAPFACPVSGLENMVYSQDFSTLDADTPWFNGTCIAYCHAYLDGEAWSAEKMPAGSAGSAVAKFYALDGGSLGLLGSKEHDLAWGIAFTNDTEEAVVLSSVSFKAAQIGFANTEARRVAFSALKSSAFATPASEGDWKTDEGWVYETPATAADVESESPALSAAERTAATARTIEAAPLLKLAPGETAVLKWEYVRDAAQTGKCAMVAIDDIEVVFVAPAKPFSVRIVGL